MAVAFTPGQVLTAAEMNAAAGDTGWIAFSSLAGGYTNSWANNAGPASYRVTGNVVRFRGSITGGSTNTAAFTLPVGARPAVSVGCTGNNSGGAISAVVVEIATNGVTTIFFSAGSTPIGLDGITFTID